MNRYTLYNLVLGIVVVGFAFRLLSGPGRRDRVLLAARIALIVTMIGYPWDFFAIHLGVWSYPNAPGPKLYGVPLNDLLFMWECTFLSAATLIVVTGREPRRKRHPEGEDAG
jgi:lycopene cyclase domain-containing protein